jgi:hypothetical protein
MQSQTPTPATFMLRFLCKGSTQQLIYSQLKFQAFSLPLITILGHLEPSSSAPSGGLVPGMVTSGMAESVHSHLFISPLMSCDMDWQEKKKSWRLKDMQLHTK